ncbi:MAG TPA: hypothetical protein VHQ86_04435 [Candidatus Saccharimonadia bacterium]|jgi:hypothetical protein|nr:hypothetical protein [Candidatus Saccharimonadia bacterium]
MLVVAFVQWWYGPGWRDAAGRMSTRIRDTFLTFSVPILIKTMFAPWRRIITYPGASLGDRMRAVGDNLVSRAVGFTVRLFALLMALALITAYFLFGGLLLLLWPAIPLLGPALIVGGLI